MGSCGNACCAAEFTTDKTPAEVFAMMTKYLESGGSDGLFAYKTGGTAGLGISGGAGEGTWDSIFQGTHTTFKMRYVDTVNLVGSDLGFGPMTVLFGCGASPSLPVVSGAAALLEMETPGASEAGGAAVPDAARLQELSLAALASAACTLAAVRLWNSLGSRASAHAQPEQAPYHRVV